MAQQAIAVFKILYNLIDIPDTYLTLVSSVYHTRGHSMKLQQPTTRIDSYLHSFFPSSIKIWNALPEDVVSAATLNKFKNKLSGLD